MSTRLWKNVVTGRHRMDGGMPRGLPTATGCGRGRDGPSQSGGYQSRSGPNFVTPSLSWLSSTNRGGAPRSSATADELGVVVDDGDGFARRRRGGRRG